MANNVEILLCYPRLFLRLAEVSTPMIQNKISKLVIVQCRTGSNRLPNKVLKDLGGKNMLTVFMERIKKAREHTAGYMWDNPEKFKIGNVTSKTNVDYSMKFRSQVDYEGDYRFWAVFFSSA